MAQTRPFFDPAKLPVVYHPGETLDEKLQEMGMGVKEFATRVSKPEKTIIEEGLVGLRSSPTQKYQALDGSQASLTHRATKEISLIPYAHFSL